MEDKLNELNYRSNALEAGLQDTQFSDSPSIFRDVSEHGRRLADLETKVQLLTKLLLDQKDHLHAKKRPEHAKAEPQLRSGLHAGFCCLADPQEQNFEYLHAEVATMQVNAADMNVLSAAASTEAPMHGVLVEQGQGSHSQMEELQHLGDQPTATELKELKQKIEHLQAEVATLQAKNSLAFEIKSADMNVLSTATPTEASVQSESYPSGLMFNPYLEYTLGESMWDTSLILGLSEVGPASSFFLGVVFLVNMFVQIFMVYILLDPEMEFNNARFFSVLLEEMANWRQTDGHDYTLENTDGVNLVNRVCNIDESLSVASLQVQTLKEINSYLKLERADLWTDSLTAPGPVLCMVCILFFALLVIHEFKQDMYFLFCISALPKRCRTLLKKSSFVSISLHRLICIILLSCVRLGISLCLLYSGLIWLSSTNSMSDLILNAAGLGFVLEVDEVLFKSIVPRQVVALVHSVEPLHFNAYLYRMDAVLPVSFTMATLAFAYWHHILPNRNIMLDIKDAMCGPSLQSLNFVLAPGSEQTGIILSRYSTPFSASSEYDGKGARLRRAMSELSSDPSKVIEGYVWGNLTSRLERGEEVPIESMWVDSDAFSAAMDMDIAAFSKNYNPICLDLDDWWFFEDREFVYILERIRRMANIREGLSPAMISSDAFFRCSDYAKYCDVGGSDYATYSDAAMLRMLCPQMCGCNSPLSGLWFGLPGSMSGCPESCAKIHTATFSVMPCIDYDVGGALESLALQINMPLPESGDSALDFFDVTRAHILDFLSKKFAQEFHSERDLGAYLETNMEAVVSRLSNLNMTLMQLQTNVVLMSWIRYWKFATREVARESWKYAFQGCEGAVTAQSFFNDLQYSWNPCEETEEMAASNGVTSIRGFCKATCYEMLRITLLPDLRDFRSCQETK